MKTLISVILTFFLCRFSVIGADNGTVALTTAIQKIEKAPSISARFVLTEGSNKVKGLVVASGKCFAISGQNIDFETWYDGKTQWTWSRMTDEVNITEPTQEELLDTNPFAIIKAAASGYNATVVDNKNGMTVLKLIPKNAKSNTIKEMELTLSTSSNLPAGLKVITNDKQTIIFTFSDINIGKTIPATEFRYKNSYHPESEIIDLR